MPTLAEILRRARRQQLLGPGFAPIGEQRLRRRASIHLYHPATNPEKRGLAQMSLASFLEHCKDDLTAPPTFDEVWDFFDFIMPYVEKDPAKLGGIEILIDLLRSGGIMRIFTQLTRTVVVYQLALRILDPSRINQKRTGLCGPAALAMEIAGSRPDEFAKFAADLVRTGRGQICNYIVHPSEQIRNYRIPRNSIPEADFLVLASLRDSSIVLDETTDLGQYHGSSLVNLFDWCVSCGYQHVVMYMTPPQMILRAGHVKASLVSLIQTAVFRVCKTLVLFTTETPIIREFPLLSAPLLYPFKTRLEVARRMAELIARGDKVFLLCHKHLAEAAESFHMAIRHGLTMTADKPESQHGAILRDWADHGTSEALRELAKIDAAPHWVLLEEFLISGDKVSIRIVHHGGVRAFTGLPLDGVLMQVLGFVAARQARHSISASASSHEAPF